MSRTGDNVPDQATVYVLYKGDRVLQDVYDNIQGAIDHAVGQITASIENTVRNGSGTVKVNAAEYRIEERTVKQKPWFKS